MKKTVLLVAIHCLLVAVCAKYVEKERQIYQSTGDDEYDVYSAVLCYHFERMQVRFPKSVVVRQKVDVSTHWRHIYTGTSFLIENGDIDSSLAYDFWERNEEALDLEMKFGIPADIVLITDHELKELDQAPGAWSENFRERYPHSRGIFLFSRVGFNVEHTTALVCYSQTSSHMTGRGYLITLAKKDSRWSVVNTRLLWIAC